MAPPSADSRHALGAYYSPPALVNPLVRRVLDPLLKRRRHQGGRAGPRLCDPACGDGAFLTAALERLCRWRTKRAEGPLAPGWAAQLAQDCLFGVDLDPEAVRATRAALREGIARWDPKGPLPDLRDRILCANALLDAERDPSRLRPLDARSWRPEAGFDAILGNPPFVDAEEMVRSTPALRRLLAGRYETARGNWDLCCLFVERALQWLAADGWLGFVLPNKLLAAEYAQTTRRVLAAERLVLLQDHSGLRLFDAAVNPLVLVARRGTPSSRGVRMERMGGTAARPRPVRSCEVPAGELAALAKAGWSTLMPAETSAATRISASSSHPQRALGELVDIVGAATVAEAYALANLVEEKPPRARAGFRLVNTGTLDPFCSLWGRRPLRYLGQRWETPWVRRSALQAAFPRRLAQAESAKIIVAGLTRRLECHWDEGRCLAGKSTSLLLPSTPEQGLLLLGLLGSSGATTRYRAQFGGLALSGGYLRVGPPQLRAFPVPDPGSIDAPRARAIVKLAEELLGLGAAGRSEGDPDWRAAITRLDGLVNPLFGPESVVQ